MTNRIEIDYVIDYMKVLIVSTDCMFAANETPVESQEEPISMEDLQEGTPQGRGEDLIRILFG